MTVIITHITVSPSGTISAYSPIPVGEHVATITVAATPQRTGKPFMMEHFPVHDGYWDGRSLRRKDIYGDDGRLPAFTDTNFIVYASRKGSLFHGRAAATLQQARKEHRALWISRQFLRDYLIVVMRPQHDQVLLLMIEAIQDVDFLKSDFNIAEDRLEVWRQLCIVLACIPVAGKQVHDANTVVTTLTCGVKCMFTFNEADFHRFGEMIEVIIP